MNVAIIPMLAASLLTRSASFVLHLHATPRVVFPLFDPVNESKWDPQWKPRLLGNAVEEGLVFLVGDGTRRETWLLDRYDPRTHRIAYVVSRHATLTRILIDVRAEKGGSAATVTYVTTALDAQHLPGVEHFAKHFPLQREHWESAINSVLTPSSQVHRDNDTNRAIPASACARSSL